MQTTSPFIPSVQLEAQSLAWTTEKEIRCRARLSPSSLLASGLLAQEIKYSPARACIDLGPWIEGEMCQIRDGSLRIKMPVTCTRLRSGVSLEVSMQAACCYEMPLQDSMISTISRYHLDTVTLGPRSAVITASIASDSQFDRQGRLDYSVECEFMPAEDGAEEAEFINACLLAIMTLTASPLMPELELGRAYEVTPLSIATAVRLSATGKVGPFTLKADGQAYIAWVDVLGMVFVRRPCSRNWALLPVKLSSTDDRGVLLELELMDDGSAVILSVLAPVRSTGTCLNCSWAIKRLWLRTYHEAVAYAATSTIKSDGIIALADGDPARPMKLKQQTVDVQYSARWRCMELDEGVTAPPSCQWPARPMHWMLRLDRQQGWLGIYSVAVDSPYIEPRPDREAPNSKAVAMQVVAASRHSDYRAGARQPVPYAVQSLPYRRATTQMPERLVERLVATAARRKLASWLSTLPSETVVVDLGCGVCRYSDLYIAAGMSMVLVDNDTGQLDKAWVKLARSGVELECMQPLKQGLWSQKSSPFACYSTSMEPSTLDGIITSMQQAGQELAVVMTLAAGHMPLLEALIRARGVSRFLLYVSQEWLSSTDLERIAMDSLSFEALATGGLRYNSTSTGAHDELPLSFCQCSGHSLLGEDAVAAIKRWMPHAADFCADAFRYLTELDPVEARGMCSCCTAYTLEQDVPVHSPPQYSPGEEAGSSSVMSMDFSLQSVSACSEEPEDMDLDGNAGEMAEDVTEPTAGLAAESSAHDAENLGGGESDASVASSS